MTTGLPSVPIAIELCDPDVSRNFARQGASGNDCGFAWARMQYVLAPPLPPAPALSTPSANPAGTFFSWVQSTGFPELLIVPAEETRVVKASNSGCVVGSNESMSDVTPPGAIPSVSVPPVPPPERPAPALTWVTGEKASFPSVTAPSASFAVPTEPSASLL